MRFSPQQDCALCAAARWLRAPGAQVFRLFGYAGTGKTTLAKHLAAHVDGRVRFAAYTGKAAHVMRVKGCKDAGTLHSLIYICTETENGPLFELTDQSPLAEAKLLIVDECSMVDARLGNRRGLLNGSIWRTRTALANGNDTVMLGITPGDNSEAAVTYATTHLAFFRGTAKQELSYFQRREFDSFDFAYALTVHKAQGSQWDDVTILDEADVFREHARRWLYTAITRAADRLTLVQRAEYEDEDDDGD